RAVDGSFAVVRYTVELAWFPTATGDWFSFQPSFGYEAWGRVARFFHWNGTHALPDLPALFEGHYLMAAVEDPHVPGLVSLWVSSGTCYRVPGADTPIYLLRFAPAPELGEGAAMPKAYVGDADGAVNVTGLREAIVANLSAGAYLRWWDAAGNPWTAPIHPAWGEVYSVGGVGVRRYLFSVSDMTGKGGVVKIMTMDRTVRCSAQMTPGGLTGLTCPLSYGEAYAVVAVWPDGSSRTSMWFTAGGAVTLNVYVSLVAVTLTQPGNLYVFESAAGRVYVSTDGVSWVELKPLTGAVELKEVKATVRVDIDAVVVGERNVTYTDPFGRTRWRIEPQYRYALRAVSTCLLADRPCGPVRVTVYRPDGTYAGELVLEPPPRGTATQSIDPWPDPAAIVKVSGFSEFGPYRVEAAQPGLATTGQLPYTYDVRPLLALLPVALFVAFGVRVSLRETALGVFAYGFLAAPLSAALGVPIQAAGAILAVCTAVAAILLLLGR
ncbi:MAG: hypothetical protein QN128_11420, partial [Armatimonadota bacterium]|nr:hypothetical protein [Armatimonadota bacterium]